MALLFLEEPILDVPLGYLPQRDTAETEMQVGAESLGDFIEFVTALEKSKVFGPPRVRGYNPPNENEPYHRYLLSVSYDQQL